MRVLLVLCLAAASCTRASPPFVWDAECDRQAASGSWVVDLDAARIRLGQRRRCPDGDQPCVAGDEGRQRAFLWDSSFASHDGGFASAMTGVKTKNGAVRMNLLLSGSIAHIDMKTSAEGQGGEFTYIVGQRVGEFRPFCIGCP
jgi:hypothetical protein